MPAPEAGAPPQAAGAEAAVLSGGCLCGAVRYAYRGVLGGLHGTVTLCHCAQCRHAQGGAVAVAPIARAGFALADPSGVMREFQSSPGKFRAFCGVCGGPLYSRRAALPKILRPRLGSLDDPPAALRIAARTHMADAPAWLRHAADAPGYDALEPQRG